MAMPRKEFYLPLTKKEQLTKDVYSFYFKRPQDLDFLPGQYIRMILPIEKKDERGDSRFFTIASSPLEKDKIMITTRVIKSSFKKKLAELNIGERAKFFGPMGGFVLNEQDKDSRVFLAGGIGITPFHSMITYAHAKNLTIPITLIVSFSRVEDMVFYEELLDIAKKDSYIKIIYTVSHPEESDKPWNGEIGRVSEDLIKKYVPSFLNPLYYIVGPPKMVAVIEDVVKNMGVPNEKIFIENFTGY